MKEQKGAHLKNLLNSLPPGFYVDSKVLKAYGVHRSSVADYVRSGWLRHVAHGLYQRPGTASGEIKQDWRVLIQSMQTIMKLPLHVGGMTALRQLGHRHYLTLGSSEPVYLYAASFPGWLDQSLVAAPLHLRKTGLFDGADLDINEASTTSGEANGLRKDWWDWSLRMSSPERAIIEALDELPDNEGFHSVDVVFQSLVNLRPRLLTALLTACKSIKVKRLFFVFAERHGHAWFKHVDRESIDLGSGDRSLVKGGRLHPVYRITVPHDLLSDSEGAASGG